MIKCQQQGLAPYACAAPRSDTHVTKQSPGDQRTSFQRDCDRIVHSTAFRLLMYKTQVFVAPICGQFRTRLTHTIEVSRVARSLAVSLRLNPDLAESVALAHDLGHPPFGHVGERALSKLMRAHGGFEHNAQALRIVTNIERSYIGFNGLNLTWETLEGIAKHNGPLHGDQPLMADLDEHHKLELDTYPTAEAQVAAIADDIAYNCHDLQDGLRAGFFTSDDLGELPIVGAAFSEVREMHPDAGEFRIAQTALRRVFSQLTNDVFATSRDLLQDSKLKSVEDVRLAGKKLVVFSDRCFDDMQTVRSFLFDQMYQNERIKRDCDDGNAAINGLFAHYTTEPTELPKDRQEDYKTARNTSGEFRAVADYIVGLTDRFAIDEHHRINGSPMQA